MWRRPEPRPARQSVRFSDRLELLPVVFGGAVEYETSVLMSDVQKSTTGKHEKVRKYENEV